MVSWRRSTDTVRQLPDGRDCAWDVYHMTASTDLRPGSLTRDPLEDKMEQVRELLFGEFKRDNDARFALVEARVRELEAGIHRKLDIIQSRIDALASDLRTDIRLDYLKDRNAAFEQLSLSVVELAERIRTISRG